MSMLAVISLSSIHSKTDILVSATPIKAALGVVEAIPILGAAIRVSSDFVLIYLVGIAAQQFYEMKYAQALSQ